MKKITTLMLLVGVLWYAAASSGQLSAILIAGAVTLTALPVWAYIVAKKTGRDPRKWLVLSILAPLIGPLILAITARRDILEAAQRERAEGKKGFWERRFGKFGELIPYAAALLLALAVFGVVRLTASGAPEASDISDISYDAINGNETGNLMNGGLWLKAPSFELFVNQEDGGKIYAYNDTPNGRVYKYSDDSARNLCQLQGFIYYINRSDHNRIYRIDTSKGADGEPITEDQAVQFVVSDRVYYINGSDGGSIYCVSRDGKGAKKLSGSPASVLFQNDGKLIYISADDNYLYEMTTAGRDSRKLTGDRAGQAFIYSNRIYYIALDDGNRIVSVAPDGTGRRLESDVPASCVNYDGGDLFFANKEDEGRLYALNLMSGQLTKLSDDTRCADINVVFCSGVMYVSNGAQRFVNVYNVVDPVAFFPGRSSMYTEGEPVMPPLPSETETALVPPADPGGNPLPPTQPDAFDRDDADLPLFFKQAWPDYLPADIPPIPADITLVQADQYFIRIWFENLPRENFIAYLEQLKAEGFSLTFIIYEQPGVVLTEADLNRLAAEGKFDAVRITKDPYDFYIEYGGEEGTFDLNSEDFLDPDILPP